MSSKDPMISARRNGSQAREASGCTREPDAFSLARQSLAPLDSFKPLLRAHASCPIGFTSSPARTSDECRGVKLPHPTHRRATHRLALEGMSFSKWFGERSAGMLLAPVRRGSETLLAPDPSRVAQRQVATAGTVVTAVMMAEAS